MSMQTRREVIGGASRLAALAALGGGGLLTACGGSDDEQSGGTSTGASSTEVVTISMMGWGGGDAPVWIKPLEKQLNVRIKYKGVTSMVDLQNLLTAAPPGTYDVAGIYNHQALPALYEADLVEPLEGVDFSALDEWSQPSAERERGPEIFDGKAYYLRAHTEFQGLLFNEDEVPIGELEEQGYDILYDDKYKGKIVVWDDAVQTMPIFGFLLGLNPFNVTDDEFEEMKAKMMELAPQVFMVPGFSEGVKAMADGSAVMSASMSGGASRPALLDQNVPANVYFDKRGVLSPSEGVSLLSGSNNPERAFEFVNAWLDPQLQANVAMKPAWSSPPSNPQAWDLLPDELKEQYVVEFDTELGAVVPKLGDKDWTLVDWISPINPTLDKWLEAWGEFKAQIKS